MSQRYTGAVLGVFNLGLHTCSTAMASWMNVAVLGGSHRAATSMDYDNALAGESQASIAVHTPGMDGKIPPTRSMR